MVLELLLPCQVFWWRIEKGVYGSEVKENMNGQGLGKAYTFLKDEIIRKDVAMLIII